MLTPHRKHRKTYNDPGHTHYLTFSCTNRWPLLSKDRTRQWFIEAIEIARSRHKFDLHAFVIMPEHAHLLVRSRLPDYDLPRFLYDVKRPVSWKAKAWLLEQGNRRWLDRLSVREDRRQTFRFWLPGGGFDNNIFRERSLLEVVDYIHANPVCRGLVQNPADWIWSSARFWAGMPDPVMRMDPLPL